MDLAKLRDKALIDVILLKINSFLSLKESTMMKLVCNEWYHTIPLKNVLILNNWHKRAGIASPREPLLNDEIKISDDQSIESIYIKCKWKDQGWGNYQGKIIIKLFRNGKEIGKCLPFGLANHDWETREISINKNTIMNDKMISSWLYSNGEVTEKQCSIMGNNIISLSKSGDIIQIWQHVGGGGGHQLFIERLMVVVSFKSP